MNILTSKFSKKSAIALGEALNCSVYNPYKGEFYRGDRLTEGVVYNMGCSYPPSHPTLNNPEYVEYCVNKIKTLNMLQQKGVLTVPWTDSKEQAQAWLDEDRIIVNRATITGKANEGLSFSYKGIEGIADVQLDEESVIWTRYVNHTRELRVYVFKRKPSLVFEKVNIDGGWFFKPIKASNKLDEQTKLAQEAFSGLVFSAYDVLECVTGDFYTLENNSAPSLLVSEKIIPRLKEVIQNELGRSL